MLTFAPGSLPITRAIGAYQDVMKKVRLHEIPKTFFAYIFVIEEFNNLLKTGYTVEHIFWNPADNKTLKANKMQD